jgi:hypothetical protein
MGMFDFRDIQAASKDEQVRAWAIEQALEYRKPMDADTTLLNTASCIEHFVKTGEVIQPQLEAVYNEAARESRFEVLEAATHEGITTPEELRDVYRRRGWIDG